MKLSMLVCVLAISIATSSNLNAAPITFTTSQGAFDAGVRNQGWWSIGVANTDANYTYFVGENGSTFDLRSFFTFDLSTLILPVDAATFRIGRGGSSPNNEAFESVRIYDVSTPAATLNNNVGTNNSISGDLASGTLYATETIPGAGNVQDIIEFTFGTAAINDINAAAGGYFSISAYLFSNNGDDYVLNGRDGTVELVVNTVDTPSAVPEPGTQVLLGLGLAVLARLKRRVP